jgi:hypothetical protein
LVTRGDATGGDVTARGTWAAMATARRGSGRKAARHGVRREVTGDATVTRRGSGAGREVAGARREATGRRMARQRHGSWHGATARGAAAAMGRRQRQTAMATSARQ